MNHGMLTECHRYLSWCYKLWSRTHLAQQFQLHHDKIFPTSIYITLKFISPMTPSSKFDYSGGLTNSNGNNLSSKNNLFGKTDDHKEDQITFSQGKRPRKAKYRSSPLELLFKKGILWICITFPGECPCIFVILVKLWCNFIEIALLHGCSPVNLVHHSCTNRSDLEVELKYLMKSYFQLNPNILTTKNDKRVL